MTSINQQAEMSFKKKENAHTVGKYNNMRPYLKLLVEYKRQKY